MGHSTIRYEKTAQDNMFLCKGVEQKKGSQAMAGGSFI